jgi:hypothetical protein
MLLRPHYARVDQEGRTLVHELFAAIGDIRVSDSELQSPLARSAAYTERPPPRPSVSYRSPPNHAVAVRGEAV